jgi:CAAX prenyl protease-like protein
MKPSPATAHIAPLALFMAFTGLVSLVAVKNPSLPWWQYAPEHWIYPLQTLVCGGLLLTWRSYYQLKPWRGIGLAMVLGFLGIACWIGPALLGGKMLAAGFEEKGWWEFLGLAPRKEGFDPNLLAGHPALYGTGVAMRFLRMVVVVPFVEELFWRSFLMRYVAAGGAREFSKVPFGTHTWPAYFITTACVVLVHQRADWLGALVFGSLMYWLAVRTKSLGACIVMHAVANLLLGIYVMVTKQWGYW